MPDIYGMPAPLASNTTKLYCPTCGKRIHPESRFCRHCGSAAEDATPINDADDFILPGDATNGASELDHDVGAPPLSAARGGEQAAGSTAAASAAPNQSGQQLFQTAQQSADESKDEQPVEHTIWQGRPAWRAFAGSWCAWLGICAAVLAVTFMYNNGGGPLVQAVWVFIGGSAAGLFARTALLVYGSRYRLTTERLFIHRGILMRITDQIELIRVDDVRIRQNIIDRLLNTGTLEIFSTDETDDTIHLFKISDPANVTEDVRNHTRAVRQQHAVAVERI